MRIKNVLASVAGFGLVFGVLSAPQAQASIFIHEILADPPAVGGDANGDGVVSTSADEFVEVYNDSSQAVDLSGWSLADSLKIRHVFGQNTWIDPMSVFVVFSGGKPVFDISLYQTASTGSLGLNNSGDTVQLFDLNGMLVDSWRYGSEGGKDQSLVRVNGDVLMHTEIDGKIFSPTVFSEKDPAHAVPETSSLVMLFAGVLVFFVIRREPRSVNGNRELWNSDYV